MPVAVYRTSAAGGGSSSTSDRTVSITTQTGDLLIVGVVVSANTNNTPTMSDDKGNTYALIQNQTCDMTGANGDRLSVFVSSIVTAARAGATVITAVTGSNTAGELVAVAYSRMTKEGVAAVRSSGKNEGAASAAPSAALNQNALTTNPTLFFCGSADTTTTFPTNWSERQDASQTSPTTALEVATRDTGFASTTITAGATQASAWGCIVIELDGLQEGGGDDAIDLTDTVVAEATYVQTVADTVATSDSATAGRELAQTYADTISVTDTAVRDFTNGREASDTIEFTDAVAAEAGGTLYDKTASDTVDVTDSSAVDFTQGREGSDNITATDANLTEEVYNRTLSDSVDLSDAYVRDFTLDRVLGDSLSVTDVAERVGTSYNRPYFLVLEIITNG